MERVPPSLRQDQIDQDSDNVQQPIGSQNPLLVPELFHSVLDSLVTSASANLEKRRALVALAQTCHAFTEPSLNHLWRRLDSLLPLIRSFAVTVDEARVKTPPSPFEWDVINRYSSRIQELTLGDDYLSLLFLRHTNLVLSNLRVFRWIYRPLTRVSIPLESIRFFWPSLAPNIATLEVSSLDKSDPTFFLFMDYPLLSLNLKSITFFLAHPSWLPEAATRALSQAIRSHSNWRHVDLPAIDSIGFRHLAMSHKLQVASLTLAPEITQSNEVLHFSPGDTPFRNVTELTLRQLNHLNFATNLLRAHHQVFHSFEVSIQGLPGAAEVFSFFTAIVTPQRAKALQSFMFRHTEIHVRDSDINRLSYATFRPLESLAFLRVLVIRSNHVISLNDEEFSGLVCNWPALENLWFTGRQEEHDTRSITLRGLLSLLASCRKLCKVGLSIDARKVPLEMSADLRRPLITQLVFKDSPIKDPELLEQFLAAYLPSVHRVRAVFTRVPLTGDDERHLQLWSQVNAYQRDH